MYLCTEKENVTGKAFAVRVKKTIADIYYTDVWDICDSIQKIFNLM